MDDIKVVDVMDASGDLRENMMSVRLWQFINGMSLKVVEEVASTHILCHKVGELFVLEFLDEVHNMEALLDGKHGIALGDLVLAAQSLVLARVDSLDSHFDTRYAMLAKPDGIAGAFTNNVFNSVLVELVLEALSIQDARQDLLPLRS